jgi:hypothetical protein
MEDDISIKVVQISSHDEDVVVELRIAVEG